MKRQGWDVKSDGLHGAALLKVIVNDQRHGSIQQAVNYLGLGQRSLVSVKTHGDSRIPADSFAQLLSETDEATIVVLNAADLNIGAGDDFEALIPMAKDVGAWVHVDGAFGLFARASARHRHLVRGLEHADSWLRTATSGSMCHSHGVRELKAKHYKLLRDEAFGIWREVTCVQTPAQWHQLNRAIASTRAKVNKLTAPSVQ